MSKPGIFVSDSSGTEAFVDLSKVIEAWLNAGKTQLKLRLEGDIQLTIRDEAAVLVWERFKSFHAYSASFHNVKVQGVKFDSDPVSTIEDC